MKATKKFEYERLSRPEIATCLSVREHDLINPSPDLVADLYTHLLIHLGFLEEENEQLAFEALAHFENPDYHVDSIRIVKLYNMIKEVLAALQCPTAKEFTLADLLTPDTQRTEFFLGAILKFVLLREENLIAISEVRDESKDLEKQQKLDETLVLQAKSEISNFNEAMEREMAIIQKVDAKVVELHNTIMVLNRNQKSLMTTLRKLKDKTEEMDAKISNAEFTLSQNAQINENLRSKIPQSPDKVQRALEEKKLALEEARKAERLVMQCFYEKTILFEVYSKIDEDDASTSTTLSPTFAFSSTSPTLPTALPRPTALTAASPPKWMSVPSLDSSWLWRTAFAPLTCRRWEGHTSWKGISCHSP